MMGLNYAIIQSDASLKTLVVLIAYALFVRFPVGQVLPWLLPIKIVTLLVAGFINVMMKLNHAIML
jgi:hypothetical protein